MHDLNGIHKHLNDLIPLIQAIVLVRLLYIGWISRRVLCGRMFYDAGLFIHII